MSRRRQAFCVLFGLAALAGALPAAAAPPTICLSLAHELDRADREATATTDRSLNDSIFSQRQQLDLATVDARRAGCLGGTLFRQQPAVSCGTLMAAIEQMEGNLRQLTDERRMGPQPYREERARILADLSANGCDGIYDLAPRPRGVFASLFGDDGTYDDSGPDTYDPSGRENSYVSIPGYGDTYRTLCVRTCDGYYFPISFSTEPSRFSDDAEACAAACPGAEVSLYVHHSPGEGVEQMVSLSGEPYTALPTAFAYRKAYNPACTCRAGTAAAGFTPVPVLPKATEPAKAPAGPSPLADAKRNVRIVGPSYYVAQ
jgi:hypothetical protein